MENTSTFHDGEHGYSVDMPMVTEVRGRITEDKYVKTQTRESVFIAWSPYTCEWTVFETTTTELIYRV